VTRAAGSKRSRRRAFATLMVFVVIVFGAILVATIQAMSLAQASAGRESLARVRAYWAARAGVEATMARLEAAREEGDDDDAFHALESMAQVADGELSGSSWRIRTTQGKQEVAGPEDCAAKLNLHRLTPQQFLEIKPYMGEDVIDSIADWYDEDDDTRPLGAELGYYAGLPFPFQPRNAPLRSIGELEVVAGVDARDVRGEDWNLNGVLDPEEDDGDASWPADNADGVLDRGWAGVLTVLSAEDPRGKSGEDRLDLAAAEESQVVQRLGVTNEQAAVIIDYAQQSSVFSVSEFIRRPLPRIAQDVARRQGKTQQEIRQAGRMRDLTREQLGLLIDECTVGEPSVLAFVPGRLNVNTCDPEALDAIPEIDPSLSDSIISERAGKPQGFASIADLLDVPGMTRAQLATISDLLTTRSNVYSVACSGTDETTGIEVEIVATLDASTLPASYREVRVR